MMMNKPNFLTLKSVPFEKGKTSLNKNQGLKMNKRAVAYLQIYLVMSMIIAFALILNMGMGSATYGDGFVYESMISSGASEASALETAAAQYQYGVSSGAEGAGISWGGVGSGLKAIGISAVYAGIAYGAVQGIGKLIDQDERYGVEIDALSAGVAATVGIGKLSTAALGLGSGGATPLGILLNPWTIGAGILVFAYTYLTAEEIEHTTETISFKCMSWQAPTGGASCEKCNTDDDIPCSEYRCKSLGQGCGIINAGTGNEKCIWMDPKDSTSPGIKPLGDALPGGYAYSNVKARPAGGGEGSFGMDITSEETTDGCIKAFTPIEFGIITSEPAQCKIAYDKTEGFDNMGYFIGEDNLFKQEHTQKVSLPGTKLLNSLYPEIENDGQYRLYIRCMDGNGNQNRDEFAINFCVDPTPDVTPPIVEKTTIENNAPVQYQVDEVNLGLYLNEPGSCKWDRVDASYESMTNDVNCNNQVWEMNADLLYSCATTLTSIKDREDNNFYFRCQDLANNTMHQSYKFTLVGTQPLDIIEVGPTETIGGSNTVVQVNLTAKTDNGYKNGDSTCSFSPTSGAGGIEFANTEGNVHSQVLDLGDGSYEYFIRCVDAGGNSAEDSVSFDVIIDNTIPQVIRAYNENDKIKVVTDEEAECRYSSESCNYNFEIGTNMPDDGSKINHYGEWLTGQSYYIKCSDEFDNVPNPTACSIIVRPSSV